MNILTIPIFLFLIAFCFLLSIFLQDKSRIGRFLPAFFFMLFIIELICYYLKIVHVNNLIIYNFWFPLEFLFYTFWISNYLQSKIVKKVFNILMGVYVAVVIIIYSISANLFKFNTIAFQLGFILLLPVALLKLYELINQPIISNPLYTPLFWLITGILVSYVFSLAQFSALNYLHINNKFLSEALKKINFILADILYSCIIIYFILKWKQKKLHT